MGTIGVAELVIMAFIGVLLLGGPVAVLIWLLTRRPRPSAMTEGQAPNPTTSLHYVPPGDDAEPSRR